jgi:hypothetical protein
MIDATSIMLTAFGGLSLAASFLQYRFSRNKNAINNLN